MPTIKPTKKNRVLFVYPTTKPKFMPVKFYHGIASLSAVLKHYGYKTDMLYIWEFDKNKIIEKIDSFKPSLIAVSTVTDQLELAKNIMRFIDRKYKIPIFLGGIHATVDPEESIQIPEVKGICIGEGEYALLELIDAFEQKRDYYRIKNFWFKKGNKVIKNPLRPLIEDLDELPFSDREIFEKNAGISDEVGFKASRNCPYKCSFCVNKFMMNLYKGKGKYIRWRSVDNLIKEMLEVKKKYKIRKILMDDEIFGIGKGWLKEFCEKYEKYIKLPFIINTRVDLMDEETVRMLKKAGCFEFRMAIESGNDYLRNVILRKNITKKQIIDAFRLVQKYGMKASTFIMIGVPYETEETINETIKLCRKVKPYRMGVAVFQPYKSGYELYKLCKEKNWISNRKSDSYFNEVTVLDQPSIKKETITYYKRTFIGYVNYPILSGIIDKIRITRKYSLYTLVLKIKQSIVLRLPQKHIDFLMKYIKTF